MVFLIAALSAMTATSAPRPDPRNIADGCVIPSLNYADQPYVVVTPRGDWVCVITTGPGKEGQLGQHVAATTSTDQGRTWSPLVPIEPASGPAASWAVPLVTPAGRVYAFYTYNGERVHLGRDDTHGWYCFRFSEDGGRSWSRRCRVPIRPTACDKLTRDGKLVQMFWGVCKPVVADGAVYTSLTKLGRYFLGDGEGWVLKSDNILTEPDPGKLHWELLPEGQHGIRNPGLGPVQEEHIIAPLSRPGHLVCVYRTTQGFPAISYSRDGARSWSQPEPMRYRPAGRALRHPRACPQLWRCANGKFLFWSHQHGGRDFRGRNPVWLCGGVEKNGIIIWSEPELLLYDDNPRTRISYPCLIEDRGGFWVTETQKSIARVHKVDAALLEALWRQLEGPWRSTTRGLVLSLDQKAIENCHGVAVPELPDLSQRGGFTLELHLTLSSLKPGQVILEARGSDGRGFAVSTKAGTLALTFSDGHKTGTWDVDKGLLRPGRRHHVDFIVDGGPAIVTCVVDGRLCDGATHPRQRGWGRFERALGRAGGGLLRVPARARPFLKALHLYSRPLLTSEAVANYRAAQRRSNGSAAKPSRL